MSAHLQKNPTRKHVAFFVFSLYRILPVWPLPAWNSSGARNGRSKWSSGRMLSVSASALQVGGRSLNRFRLQFFGKSPIILIVGYIYISPIILIYIYHSWSDSFIYIYPIILIVGYIYIYIYMWPFSKTIKLDTSRISSASARPSKLEQRFRAPQQRPSRLEQRFRAPWPGLRRSVSAFNESLQLFSS